MDNNILKNESIKDLIELRFNNKLEEEEFIITMGEYFKKYKDYYNKNTYDELEKYVKDKFNIIDDSNIDLYLEMESTLESGRCLTDNNKQDTNRQLINKLVNEVKLDEYNNTKLHLDLDSFNSDRKLIINDDIDYSQIKTLRIFNTLDICIDFSIFPNLKLLYIHNNRYNGELLNLNKNIEYIILHQCGRFTIPYLPNLKVLYYRGSMSNASYDCIEEYNKLKKSINWNKVVDNIIYW